jgi:CHASE2 domain-containing sensor protein
MTEEKPASLPKRLLAAAAMGLVLTGLVWFLEIFGALAQLERMTNDIEALFPATTVASPVVLVIITDQDYQQLFNSKSPLLHDSNGQDTGGTLKAIIDKIAEGKPAVIGVDIDTSDERYANLEFKSEPPIVWEQEIAENTTRSKSIPVLGNNKSSRHLTGVPFLLRDQDGVVRFYARHTRVPDGLPSLPWEVVRTYSKATSPKTKCLAEDPSDQEPRLILYSSPSQVSRSQLSAGSVLALNSVEDRFAGKIVLLGGDYLGMDRHKTPLSSEMLGVEVLANIIETDWRTDCAGGSPELSKTSRFVLLFFQNFILAFVLREPDKWGRKQVVAGAIAVVGAVSVFFFFRTIIAGWRFVTAMACLLLIELAQKGKEEANKYIGKKLGIIEKKEE